MQTATMIRAGLLSLGLVFLSGCSQSPSKPVAVAPMTPLTTQAPLATQLDAQQEYEFALDLAELEVKKQRYQRAETLLQKLRKVQPDDERPFRLLAQVYEAQGSLDRAYIAWQQVNLKSQASANDEAELARLALMNEDYLVAEQLYQAWLNQEDLVQKVSALNNLGFSQLLQKQYSQAQSYFQQALKLDPLNNRALNNLKLVRGLTGQP